ncbi:MAG: hypothetical protein J6U92_05215 [Clostridia bacterium]|nr:hypothetical protein [Clostridia bacterium]
MSKTIFIEISHSNNLQVRELENDIVQAEVTLLRSIAPEFSRVLFVFSSRVLFVFSSRVDGSESWLDYTIYLDHEVLKIVKFCVGC